MFRGAVAIMTLDKYITDSGLAEFDELDKVLYLAFYHLKKNSITEFSQADAAKWIRDQNMGNPNVSRLGTKLKNSRSTTRGSKAGMFCLHHKLLTELDGKFPQLSQKSQEVLDDGTILPPALYDKTRGYIESLAKQINRSYEENIFDGCAVLMRRLEEVLLILSYEHLGIAAEIKDAAGQYLLLEGIVKNAQGNAKLGLSRNAKPTIEAIRKLGNYSAHKVTYTCKREYIKEEITDFRALVDELLHKAGILK
ncbi:MAG: hypothetical protein JNM66_22165 [Bryobacterales bacterium]|nr:hypothetical protein [Bryobacterales bacterium]